MNSDSLNPSYRRSILRALAILALPAFAVLGCCVGLFFTGLATDGILTHWHPLGAPPEKPVRIIAADFDQVGVASERGHLYHFEAKNSIWGGEAPEGRWLPTSESDMVGLSELARFSRCDFSASGAPSPPLETVDFVQFGYCPEPLIDVRYAILTDGTIWRWSTPDGLHFAFKALPVGIVIGLLVGLLVGIIVWRGAGPHA